MELQEGGATRGGAIGREEAGEGGGKEAKIGGGEGEELVEEGATSGDRRE